MFYLCMYIGDEENEVSISALVTMITEAMDFKGEIIVSITCSLVKMGSKRHLEGGRG